MFDIHPKCLLNHPGRVFVRSGFYDFQVPGGYCGIAEFVEPDYRRMNLELEPGGSGTDNHGQQPCAIRHPTQLEQVAHAPVPPDDA